MRLISLKELKAADSYIKVGEEADFNITLEGTAAEIAYPFRLTLTDRKDAIRGDFPEADLNVDRTGVTTAIISKVVPTSGWGDICGPMVWALYAVTASGEKPVQWGEIQIERLPI